MLWCVLPRDFPALPGIVFSFTTTINHKMRQGVPMAALLPMNWMVQTGTRGITMLFLRAALYWSHSETQRG